MRKFAPVYGIHYENVIVENGVEHVAFENLKSLEKHVIFMYLHINCEICRNRQNVDEHL